MIIDSLHAESVLHLLRMPRSGYSIFKLIGGITTKDGVSAVRDETGFAGLRAAANTGRVIATSSFNIWESVNSYRPPFALLHDVQSLRRRMWHMSRPHGGHRRRSDRLDLLTRITNGYTVVPNETIHARGKKDPQTVLPCVRETCWMVRN